jgi:outer membrane protein assembly factor BamC
MKFPASILVVLITLNLLACSSSPEDLYGNSRVQPDLEIPPDLTVENSDTRLELPSSVSADNKGIAVTGGKTPVLPEMQSIKLEGYADFYWISVEGTVDDMYQLVKNFWKSEGFILKMDEPVIGIMQTEWIYNKEGASDEDKNFFAKFFGEDDLSGSQDQFKTRIARDAETGTTQIYISHRGTAYSHVLSTKADDENNVGNEWSFRASDNELEVEMLSRLMIYLGMERSELDEHLVNIRLFAPRASLQVDYKENETYLELKGEYSRNWHRTLHQLERLNFEVLESNMSSGLSGDGVMLVVTDIDIKVEKSGFFTFSTEYENQKKQIYLVFTEETPELTRISMEDKENEIDNSPEAVEFLTLLYGFLK